MIHVASQPVVLAISRAAAVYRAYSCCLRRSAGVSSRGIRYSQPWKRLIGFQQILDRTKKECAEFMKEWEEVEMGERGMADEEDK